jgi:phage terminase small subunit
MALTPKQQRFVEEYLLDLNATQAAIRAGYSAQTARQAGAENLSKPVVALAITEAKAARSARTAITADRVLEELAVIGFSNVWDYALGETGDLSLTEGTPRTAERAVASIKRKRRVIPQGEDRDPVVEYDTEFRLWSKPEALKLTAQHLGMFSSEGTTTVNVAGPAQVMVVGGRRIRF